MVSHIKDIDGGRRSFNARVAVRKQVACAGKVIRSECVRINGGRSAERLPRLLMQVKAPNARAMSLIVLSGSIG
jgi:hypothetical protein